MKDALIGKVVIPQNCILKPIKSELIAAVGEEVDFKLRYEGCVIEGEVEVGGNLTKAVVDGSTLTVFLKAPGVVGDYILQIEGGKEEIIIPLKVKGEFVIFKSVDYQREGGNIVVKTLLKGPKMKRIRGDLSLELKGEGNKKLDLWRRRVAVKDELLLEVKLVDTKKEASSILITFRKGSLVESKVVRITHVVKEKKEVEPKEEEVPPLGKPYIRDGKIIIPVLKEIDEGVEVILKGEKGIKRINVEGSLQEVEVLPGGLKGMIGAYFIKGDNNVFLGSVEMGRSHTIEVIIEKIRSGKRGYLFPSEDVKEEYLVDGINIKKLTSPTMLITKNDKLIDLTEEVSEEVQCAISTLIFLNPSQIKRFEEILTWAEDVINFLDVSNENNGNEELVDMDKIKDIILDLLRGGKGKTEELTEYVQEKLKKVKEEKTKNLKEVKDSFASSLRALLPCFKKIKHLKEKRVESSTIAEMASAEIIASIRTLKALYTWERGTWGDYPSLRAQEKFLIKGLFENIYNTIKRLHFSASSSRELLRRYKQNLTTRKGLEAFTKMRVGMETDVGEVEEGKIAEGKIRIVNPSDTAVDVRLSFLGPQSLVILNPPVTYSGGRLKTEVFSVKGVRIIPLKIELLPTKNVRDIISIKLSLLPEMPPIQRELKEGRYEK